MLWHKKIKFITTTTNERFQIDGANIFDGFDIGKTCKVNDPSYGKRYSADIYEITGKTKKFKVAIAEFSPCVYGIYMIED